jgi:hypothetical protein
MRRTRPPGDLDVRVPAPDSTCHGGPARTSPLGCLGTHRFYPATPRRGRDGLAVVPGTPGPRLGLLRALPASRPVRQGARRGQAGRVRLRAQQPARGPGDGTRPNRPRLGRRRPARSPRPASSSWTRSSTPSSRSRSSTMGTAAEHLKKAEHHVRFLLTISDSTSRPSPASPVSARRAM